MTTNISVLISTVNKRITNINYLRYLNEKSRLVIVHQIYDGNKEHELYHLRQSDSLTYKVLNYSGLSKSRNIALSLCKTKYAYIMDDDVEFDLEKIYELVEQMEKDKVDIATCKFRYTDGGFPKKYQEHSFAHDMLSVAKVASIEMCVNIEALNKHGIRFDERFGLGASYPSGEEYIFLTDCIKAGLRVKYYPILTGIHPNETSGLDFYTSPAKTLAKREMLMRVFRWKSAIYIFAFWLKKLPEVVRQGYGLRFTKTLILGIK